MRDALDAMLEKKLITEALQEEGGVCALGAVGVKRGIDMSNLSPYDADAVSKTFKVARCLAAEVAWVNDEWWGYFGHGKAETPEQRWVRVRKWVEDRINGVPYD